MKMPSDQGRRHPQHHFSGFLGRSFRRTKSKSSEHLDPGSQDKKLDKRKRVLSSSRDLAPGDGFDNVLAELSKQEKFEESEKDTSCSVGPVEQSQASKQPKTCVDDTVPFSVKYAVAKNTTTQPTFSMMSVAVMSPTTTTTTQFPVIPTDGDPDMLELALTNIRTKLKEMSSERTSMESRLEELEDGLESAYFQYRLKHPDSAPLPFFNMTPFDVATPVGNPAATDEVDGLGSGSLPNGFSGDGPVASVVSLPSKLQHTRPRGDRFLTRVHPWQSPESDMVDAKYESENTTPKTAGDAGSPKSLLNTSFATPPGSPPQTLQTTHHILNTTPPSSPRSERTTTSPISRTKGLLPQPPHTPAKRPPGHARLQRTRAYAVSPALQTPTTSPTAHTSHQGLSWFYPTPHSSISSPEHSLSQPTLRGPGLSRQGQLPNRNSMPEKLIMTTIAESNSRVSTTPQGSPAFRRRSDSGGRIERPGRLHMHQLLTRRISEDSLKKREQSARVLNTPGNSQQGDVWFEDF